MTASGAEAVGIGAFRACAHDRGCTYLAVIESPGPASIDAIRDAAERQGVWCSSSPRPERHAGCYAVLDFLDAEGDGIWTECIPTPQVWAWWVRAVELRCTSSDCPECEPAGYAAVYA